jgi:hypothetical protein
MQPPNSPSMTFPSHPHAGPEGGPSHWMAYTHAPFAFGAHESGPQAQNWLFGQVSPATQEPSPPPPPPAPAPPPVPPPPEPAPPPERCEVSTPPPHPPAAAQQRPRSSIIVVFFKDVLLWMFAALKQPACHLVAAERLE